MVHIVKLAASLLLISLLCSHTVCQTNPWDRVPQILSRIKPPTFPSRICDIIDHGAIRSGPDDVDAIPTTVNANTKAFEDAIYTCNALGGGTVYVPSGTFITSAISLKSNIALHISEQAIVRFTRDTSKYPLVYTRWEGTELMNYSPFIYAFQVENIAITGNGVLDGNSDCEHWWLWKDPELDWASPTQCYGNSTQNQMDDKRTLLQMAENNITVDRRVFGQGHFLRPQFIQPYRSRNVLIEDVTVINAPMWIIHPVLCENVIIRNVFLESFGPNNDGVDPESSRDVWITGVRFNSGDDDIAIKSGNNADGRRVNVTSENFVIQNCTMLDGHGGITIGSEIAGGVKNIFAENCYLDSPRLYTAFRIKNNAMRGGVVEDIYFRDMRVGKVAKQVIEVDFYYDEGPNGAFRPVIRDYVIENINVIGGAPYSIFIRGYPDHPTTSYIGITLRNISFTGLTNDPHYVLQDIDFVSFSDVAVDGVVWDVKPSSARQHFIKYEILLLLFVILVKNL